MTRLSFTTTAAVSAPGTRLAVATVWPTSCTLAPVQVPNAETSSPSGPRSAGSRKIAMLPHSVTRATATAASSSSPSATSFIAATAEAPQMAKPVATSSARGAGTPIQRPTSRVPVKVMATVTTTRASPTPPRCASWLSASCRPSRTTAIRSTR